MKNKQKKTKIISTEITAAELFVDAISKKDNIKAKECLSKIVLNKCKKRFKNILAEIKTDK